MDIKNVSSKKDFIHFIDNMMDDFKANPEMGLQREIRLINLFFSNII